MSAGILSLCTGYGGLDLAVEAVTGARTVAVSDLDKGANKILAHRFPDVPNLGDLKAIAWSEWAGTEVMTAGYPCQPFSHAGKREGTDDPRHIFPNIAEGIRIVGPRLVVLENVRGHLALGFDTVLGTLADIGYDARWVCIRASDVGAPHRRERLFIVATPRDADSSGLEGRATVQRAHERAAGPHGVGDGTATDWGQYAPAVRRWAATLGRPAPAPTEPGAKGRPRLAPRFVEWMMGLPTGWVTEVPDLGRVEQLKALGNGVVPQQAAAALTFLLSSEMPSVEPAPEILLPTPNVFHMGNTEAPDEWRRRRLDVFQRTGTRHGPALPVVALSISEGRPLVPSNYMPEESA